MEANQYGRTLNPYRRLRKPFGAKGARQVVTISTSPATIDQNLPLSITFPNLNPNDVIVPGSAKLVFDLTLASDDPNRTFVQNLGRALVKRVNVRLSGNEILMADDADLFFAYLDLWKTPTERKNAHFQGIDESANQNVTKLRVKAGNADRSIAEEKAIADTYGTQFCIPLDFELLHSHGPLCQSALGDKLEYELYINSYERVIKALPDKKSSFSIKNISLEFEVVTHPDLARVIAGQYRGGYAFLYDRVHRYQMTVVDKSDPAWTVTINTPADSMRGILFLFEEPITAFGRDSEKFYNPKVTRVDVTISGSPNQLFSAGMRPRQQWDEIRRFFADGNKRHPEVGAVSKDLQLADVSLGEYLTSKYGLWLDLRTSEDSELHGSGRRLNTRGSEINILISKKVETAGKLNMYTYVICDGQLNVDNTRFISTTY